MNPWTLTTNDLWEVLAGQLSVAVTPYDDDRELLRKIVGEDNKGQTFNDLMRVWVGVSAQPGDSDYVLMKRKLTAARAHPLDTFRDMLMRYVLGASNGQLVTVDSAITVDSTTQLVG